MVCLLGTLAALLVLHKAASSFGLLVVAFGAVTAYSSSLMRAASAWLWCWLLWLLLQGLLFLSLGPQLLRLSVEQQLHSRTALAAQLVALLSAWLCFVPSLASSEFVALLAVLLFLGLCVYGLGVRAKGDLDLIGSVLLYILLYQVSSLTLLAQSYTGHAARRRPTEFAKLTQALWVLFVPHGVFSALAVLLQLLVSLGLFMLYRSRTPYFAPDTYDD